MRRMSFALTTEAMKLQTKTMTRRQGWAQLKVGQLIQPIEKGMGLQKGEKQVTIGCPIIITDIYVEPIEDITDDDVVLEGFPNLSREEFIAMYCRANKVKPHEDCRVICFEYTEPLSIHDQASLTADISNSRDIESAVIHYGINNQFNTKQMSRILEKSKFSDTIAIEIDGRKTKFMAKSEFDHKNGHWKLGINLTTEQLSFNEADIESLLDRIRMVAKGEIDHGIELTEQHLASKRPNFDKNQGTLFDHLSGVEKVSDEEDDDVPVASN